MPLKDGTELNKAGRPTNWDEGIWPRSLRDALKVLTGSWRGYIIPLIGAAAGAVAAEVSGGGVLATVIGTLGGPILGVITVIAWRLAKTPFIQRDEARKARDAPRSSLEYFILRPQLSWEELSQRVEEQIAEGRVLSRRLEADLSKAEWYELWADVSAWWQVLSQVLASGNLDWRARVFEVDFGNVKPLSPRPHDNGSMEGSPFLRSYSTQNHSSAESDACAPPHCPSNGDPTVRPPGAPGEPTPATAPPPHRPAFSGV